MTRVSSVEVIEKVNVQVTMPQFQLPDAESTAEIALTQALDFCVHKMGLAGRQAAVDRLRQSNGEACKYCSYSMAKQVAEYLSALDENVKAVYVADYDATPEDLCFGKGEQAPLIHLIVWAERKTSALNSLAGVLNRALAKSYADVIGFSKLTHLLDMQVVDDDDVNKRIGYGALLTSLYNRPIKLWER